MVITKIIYLINICIIEKRNAMHNHAESPILYEL